MNTGTISQFCCTRCSYIHVVLIYSHLLNICFVSGVDFDGGLGLVRVQGHEVVQHLLTGLDLGVQWTQQDIFDMLHALVLVGMVQIASWKGLYNLSNDP